LLLSAVLHLAVLGQRSFHHDESIHAKLSWDLLHFGSYRYDPTYHGPLLYYLTAATFAVLGDSDFTARLPSALAGISLIFVAWGLRRRLGESGAWWTGLLVTLSPLFLYYGRFLRMDVLEAALASAAGLAFLGTLRERRGAWWLLGLAAGLAVATKENAYVTAALAALSAGVVGLYVGPRKSLRRAVGWVRAHLAGIGLAVAVLVLVTIPIYTVGFTFLKDWCYPAKAISYWWHQHNIHRVGGPWWYHLPRLAIYEFLPIGAALVWAVRRRGRMRPLEVFLLSFGLGSVGLYCYLGEKTPWLGVHQVWAFIPLAGLELAHTFGPRGSRWGRAVAGVALAATVVTTVTASFVLDEITPARRRVEALIFVQTTPEAHAVAREGVRLAAKEGQDGEPVATVSGEAAWPMMWYWRNITVRWGRPARGLRPPLVLCDPDEEGAVRATLGPGYTRERIPLRAWWLMYQRRPTLVEAVRYALTRIPWGALGSTDIVVFHRGPKPPPVQDVAVPAGMARALGCRHARLVGGGEVGEPRGLALGPAGLVVADTALSRIVVLDPVTGKVTSRPDVPLDRPESAAWLPSGRLVVADTWHHRVLEIDPRSGALSELPPPPGGWYGPRGVAVRADGAVVVSDTGNKRLVLYGPGGGPPSILGGPGDAPGRLDEPVGVAWVSKDAIAVCDTGNRRVQLLTTDGRVLRVVPLPGAWSDFYSRPEIAVLAPDDWLVSDTPGKCLWRIRGGKVKRIVPGPPEIQPTGLAWDARTGMLVMGDLTGKVWVLEVPDG
ncbi:MAG TPA: TIGR03663 family protein, partial [Acidobacteria bacterium]|nr:TIGR03663 family protein [Acidobacteriota bacterium]